MLPPSPHRSEAFAEDLPGYGAEPMRIPAAMRIDVPAAPRLDWPLAIALLAVTLVGVIAPLA